MKKFLCNLLIMTGLTFGGFAGSGELEINRRNQFKEYTLAQGQVYKILVKKDDGVTTVTFPSAIAKIAGVNVSIDGKSDFQIAAKPGSYYFNLTAMKEGAEGTLTVIHNRNTYILYLVQDAESAYAGVNFTTGKSASGSVTSGVTPARLLSLIDITKAYSVMSERYPQDLRDSDRSLHRKIFHYGKFDIELLEVVRFNREDTLVFKVLLTNRTDEEILYDKFSFSVQLGGKTFFMSAAEASGVMPPKSSTWGFFTITGTPNGERNNFSPDNDFKVGLTTQGMEEAFQWKVQGMNLPAPEELLEVPAPVIHAPEGTVPQEPEPLPEAADAVEQPEETLIDDITLDPEPGDPPQGKQSATEPEPASQDERVMTASAQIQEKLLEELLKAKKIIILE